MPSRHLLSVAAATFLALPASAAETIWTDIVVRVYDGSGASVSERRAALEIAASIVSAASVELTWKPCEKPARSDRSPGPVRKDPCQTALAARELALRIVRSGTVEEHRRDLPLGNAMIDTQAGAGVLATVYIDRVEWIAAQTGVDRDTLLGRAIAHELGHLLMATSAHGAYGLMRAVWSPSEIRRRQKHDWILGPWEIAAIRARTGSGGERDRLLASAP